MDKTIKCDQCGEQIPPGTGFYKHFNGVICMSCYDKNKEIDTKEVKHGRN